MTIDEVRQTIELADVTWHPVEVRPERIVAWSLFIPGTQYRYLLRARYAERGPGVWRTGPTPPRGTPYGAPYWWVTLARQRVDGRYDPNFFEAEVIYTEDALRRFLERHIGRASPLGGAA